MATTNEIKQRVEAEIDAIERKCEKVWNALGEARYLDRKAWEAAGLCKNCGGSNRVNYSDTLDYSDWGSCNACNGKNPPEPRSPAREALEFAYTLVCAEHARLERREFARGAIVITFKGRKVKPGVVGIVVATAAGDYGERVCLRTTVGTTEWLAADNCIEAWGFVDDETVNDLLVADAADKAAFKARLNEATEGLPPLKGTVKQVAWAEKLRAKAVMRGMAREQAAAITDARHWIDSRPGAM